MKNTVLMTALIVMLTVAGGPAQAQPELRPQERQATPVLRVSLDTAVAMAQRQVSGQVIGADTRQIRGRIVHEIRILDGNGRLHIVRVDGETGRILR